MAVGCLLILVQGAFALHMPSLSKSDTATASSRAQGFYLMGSACYVAGDYSQAATWFEKATRSGPDLLYALCLGRAYAASGKREKAIIELTRVIASAPEVYQREGSRLRGMIYLENNQYSQALDDFKRATHTPAGTPVHPGALYGLYACAINLGFTGQAHKALDAIQKQFPALLEKPALDSLLARSFQFAPVDFAQALADSSPNSRTATPVARSKPVRSQPIQVELPAVDTPVSTPPRAADSAVGVSDDSAGAFTVQAGSFGVRENAAKLYDQLAPSLAGVRLDEAVVNGTTYYRVRIGSFASRQEAQSFADSIVRPLSPNPRIVTQ